MVKKTANLYSFADWRKDNPVESDIMDLIDAARRYADSLEPYVESAEPNEGPVRVDDIRSELEMTIERARWAIHSMMQVPQARKVVGLKKRVRGRDKSFDPETTSLSDPQVQLVLQMLRGHKKPTDVYSEVAKIIDPKEKIDARTLRNYIAALISKWGHAADPRFQSFWVERTDK
jgi:hypothetical protein